MNIFNDNNNINFDRKTILTVGTFDGVHLGHEYLLNKLLSTASNENLRPLVVTLHPHPQITLQNPNKPPVKLLNTIEERLDMLDRKGIPNVLIINFTQEFAKTPAEIFLKNILFDKVGFSKILIGYDHSFGRNREGDIELVTKLSKELNFEVENLTAISNDSTIVSSTQIRNSITNCNIELANKCLGYLYSISGKVVEGFKRGRTIGYPTANIDVSDINKLVPGNGVYAVKVEIENTQYYGMANIGVKPTFDNDDKITIEVNIFEFDDDIYGKEIRLFFIDYIRSERKFENVNELKKQLENDKLKVQSIIKEL